MKLSTSFLVLVFSAVAYAGQINAQSLLEWNFYGTSVTGKETSVDACLNDMDIVKATIVRGTGAPGNNGYTNGFVGTIQPSSTKDDAVNGNVYFEFSLQPKAGASVSISQLKAQLRTQTACTCQWMYSKNNGAFADLSPSVNMDSTGVGVDQTPVALSSNPDLQNLSSTDLVTFRIYVWGGTKVQGFGFGKSGGSTTSGYVPSIVLSGSVMRTLPVVAGWCLAPYTGVTSGSLNASTLDGNLQSAVLGRGSGFTAGSLNFAYVSTTSLLGASKSAAIANNEYFEITLNTKDAYKTSLASLTYKYRCNSSGPQNYKWRYSLNGTDFYDVGSTSEDQATVNADGSEYTVSFLDISDLQNVASEKTITLRMYLWGSAAVSQVFGLGRYYVGSVAVPTVNTVYLRGTINSVSTGLYTIYDPNGNGINVTVANHQIILDSSFSIEMPVNLNITDVAGKSVCALATMVKPGNNNITLPVSLPKGIYIVSLSENNGKRFSTKVVL
jgi:hypothetical protein